MLEVQILGACLINEQALNTTLELLTEKDFKGDNREIFIAMKQLHKNHKKVDLVTVSNIYKDVIYLSEITENIVTTRNTKQHCIDLKELNIKERVSIYLQGIITNIQDMDLQTLLGKIDTINRLDDKILESEIRDLDTNPYKGTSIVRNKFISTGMPTLDYALDDLVGGYVTLIGGRNNGGKTTFCTQIMANAIDKGFKVLIVNGEEKQEVTINKIYTTVIGRKEEYYDLVRPNKRYKKEPKPNVLKALQQWHRGKLKIFSKGESKLKTTEQLFAMLRREIKKSKQDLVVIDNLMSILTNVSDSDKNGLQADFMQQCSDLAKEYNVHIILVLHPNKTYRKGEVMESEQLSGTSDLSNKADNIITVIREYNNERIVQGLDGIISVEKNRDFSNLPKVDVHFEESTGLLLEIDEGGYVYYPFSWERFLKED